MNIRIAALDNAIAITALNLELGYPASDLQVRQWLSELLLSSNHCVIVAEHGSEVSGWLVVEKRLSLETGYKAEITGLIVSKNFRRSGIARELVAAAERWSLNKKLSRMIVLSNVARAEAHDFYRSQDFVLTKTAHNYEKHIS